MKRLRQLIIALILTYIGMSVLVFILMNKQNMKVTNLYRIEINRLQADIELVPSHSLTQQKLDELVKNYEYVQHVTYVNSEDADVSFFETNNHYYTQINTVANSTGQITGYLRYDYIIHFDDNHNLIIAQLALFVTFMFGIITLLYVFQRVMRPFNCLSNMPYELSKGNLSDEIKENKNRYFGKFIWGLGMLKNSLESHKKNELRLARDKKMLVLSISHDIKTPLNAINLYAKAIEEGLYTTPEECENAMKMIQEKTNEIDTFVGEIVKTQTEDILSIEVKQGEFYLSDLITKIKEGYAEKCSIRQIKFQVAEVENKLLFGDIDRVYEAIGNLIENAIKYGDGLVIRVDFAQEDYCQLISVFNSGKTMEDNEITHVFDSFFRGSNAEGKEGNGLGLYICSQIMHKMKGDIFVKRHPDGMEFVLVCEKY